MTDSHLHLIKGAESRKNKCIGRLTEGPKRTSRVVPPIRHSPPPIKIACDQSLSITQTNSTYLAVACYFLEMTSDGKDEESRDIQTDNKPLLYPFRYRRGRVIVIRKRTKKNENQPIQRYIGIHQAALSKLLYT